MSRNVSKVYPIPTTANDGLEIHLPGRFFYVIAASEGLNIQGFDSSENQIVDITGLGAGIGGGPLDSQVVKWRVQTASGNAGSITLAITNDPTTYAAISVSGTFALSGGSDVLTTADVACNAGAQTLVKAANGNRRTVQVSNVDGAIPIRVGDINTAAGRGIPLAQGMTDSIDTVGSIYIWNPNGGVVHVAVREVLA